MYLFTSEVVSPGHPDKCADIIADSIVDAHIIADANARVASEVFVAGKHVVIGGGVQSSKDYTKVDRSALYAGGWIVKHIAAAGLAKKATIQLSYAIGVAKPTSVSVDSYGTLIDGLDDDKISTFVSENFSLRPNWITKKFNLYKPSAETFLYVDVASRGKSWIV